ncbi:uncharacterized protein LOC124530517 [Vanessa cardui]|uniref:uncharacterized protein LOC124530517 n=1 Tax=Vanessa cardui TaxID=171605 RepID=UPI001F139819|nr:uncharacterized protein LOC124530517 [Vanessa cardui]
MFLSQIMIILSVFIAHFTNNYVFADENLHNSNTLLIRNSTFKPIINGTKYKKINSKRRSVLILNVDNTLRTHKVTSLLYKDYDDKGNILNTHAMYDLRDVVTFFEVFLDTEICHEKCSTPPAQT